MILDTADSQGPDDSKGLSFSSQILVAMQKSHSEQEFLAVVMPQLCKDLDLDAIGLVQQIRGNWVTKDWEGGQISAPETLVPRALDQAQSVSEGGWLAIPLENSSCFIDLWRSKGIPVSAAAFVFHPLQVPWEDRSVKQITEMEEVVRNLSTALGQLRWTDHCSRRLGQLTAVVEAAANWQRHDDDQTLLEAIADAATRILECDRASIFLWDRKRKKLVGRPALGVPGGILEVDDSAGVVGEVLQSGLPQIWNRGSDEESRVNRRVDESLEFETHSLIAVPMFDMRNRLIGVFEAINHAEFLFDESHGLVLADLASHASAAIESHQVRSELTATRDRLVDDAAAKSPLIGSHESMVSIKETARKVAGTDLGVLIRGGNGTGKEVLARTIHFESNRRAGPFIAVNCAALVESLLESELFGHEKGSFTDAQATRVGKFELADRGTLFLDEVGDMSPGGQAKLLRVLEEKVVVRVGGSQTIPVDVRVIAATNQPLEELIEKKLFREDLFFRLNVVNMTLPDLRHRGDDILVLAEHFLLQFCSQIGRKVPDFKNTAKQALLAYPWPGNIRELRNTIERVAYLCSEEEIDVEDLMMNPSMDLTPSKDLLPIEGTLNEATRSFQVQHIRRAIELCDGKMTQAAKLLGLHRSNLYRKMHQLGMPAGEEASDPSVTD